MTALVVDASVALTWLFDDESDVRADAAIAALAHEGGFVPQHWHYEIRNGLLVAVRRNRLSRDDLTERLRSLAGLPVTTDFESNLNATLGLAIEHGLTFYDALYLELAMRLGLPLATLDGDLDHAARAAGVRVSFS